MANITVIYHSADYDGLFSGAICKYCLEKNGNNVTLIGWDFGDSQVKPEESTDEVYVVDLPVTCIDSDSMPPHENIVWIDHHISSIREYGHWNLRGIQTDNVAACRLTWQWFNSDFDKIKSNGPVSSPASDYIERKHKEPLSVTLVGEYDIWDKRDPRAEHFQFGLTANGPWTPESIVDKFLRISAIAGSPTGDLEASRIDKICSDGQAAMKWQQAFAAEVCAERGYMSELWGLKFWTLISVHTRNSMWFPEGSVPQEADALCCCRIVGVGKIGVSLYHKPGREDLDLSVFAKKMGGGGHRGACGFLLTFGQAFILELLR